MQIPWALFGKLGNQGFKLATWRLWQAKRVFRYSPVFQKLATWQNGKKGWRGRRGLTTWQSVFFMPPLDFKLATWQTGKKADVAGGVLTWRFVLKTLTDSPIESRHWSARDLARAAMLDLH